MRLHLAVVLLPDISFLQDMFADYDLLFPVPEESILNRAEGGFARRVFVLICLAGRPFDYRPFLSKVLSAVQVDLERDTLLAEVHEGEIFSLLPVIKEKQAERVLVFGCKPESCGLALEWPLYQPLSFYNSNFLFADPLRELEPDKTRKGLLWLGLKQLFDL